MFEARLCRVVVKVKILLNFSDLSELPNLAPLYRAWGGGWALAQIFFIIRKMDLVIFSLLCQDHGCQQSHQKIQTQTFLKQFFLISQKSRTSRIWIAQCINVPSKCGSKLCSPYFFQLRIISSLLDLFTTNLRLPYDFLFSLGSLHGTFSAATSLLTSSFIVLHPLNISMFNLNNLLYSISQQNLDNAQHQW